MARSTSPRTVYAAKVRRRMAAYRPIDEAGLVRLDDPGLIDQALAARAAGDGLYLRHRAGSVGDALAVVALSTRLTR